MALDVTNRGKISEIFGFQREFDEVAFCCWHYSGIVYAFLEIAKTHVVERGTLGRCGGRTMPYLWNIGSFRLFYILFSRDEHSLSCGTLSLDSKSFFSQRINKTIFLFIDSLLAFSSVRNFYFYTFFCEFLLVTLEQAEILIRHAIRATVIFQVSSASTARINRCSVRRNRQK